MGLPERTCTAPRPRFADFEWVLATQHPLKPSKTGTRRYRSESKQAMLSELGAVPVVADALDISCGQINGINSVVNPDKLSHLGPVGDFRSLLRSAR